MYLNRLYNKQSATCIIAMMKKMDFNLFKIFFIFYFVDQSIAKNQTEQRNGKVYREYFFLEKMITMQWSQGPACPPPKKKLPN